MANSPPTVKADHLKVDPEFEIEVPTPTFTPKWAVISFLSPEDQLKQRFIMEANRFLFHDVNQQLIDSMSYLTKEVNIRFDQQLKKKIDQYRQSDDSIHRAMADLLDTVRLESKLDGEEMSNLALRKYRINAQELQDRFEMYQTRNVKELDAEFQRQYSNQPSIRGFKIRGCYQDLEMAHARAKYVRDEIEPAIHAYVAPVGYWIPWDPNPDGITDQEYAVKELNDLMAGYKQNAAQRDEFFQKRKQMMMDEIEQENMAKQDLKGKLKARTKKKKKKKK